MTTSEPCETTVEITEQSRNKPKSTLEMLKNDSWIWADVEAENDYETNENMLIDDMNALPSTNPPTAIHSCQTTMQNTPSTSPSLDVQQLQKEVSDLRTQNKTLLKNICRLYLTAKKEVYEKNKEIERISALLSANGIQIAGFVPPPQSRLKHLTKDRASPYKRQ